MQLWSRWNDLVRMLGMAGHRRPERIFSELMQQGLDAACFQLEKFLMASTWCSLHFAVQVTCINGLLFPRHHAAINVLSQVLAWLVAITANK